ncbi:unnamed protein product, partial [Brenthis ino]
MREELFDRTQVFINWLNDRRRRRPVQSSAHRVRLSPASRPSRARLVRRRQQWRWRVARHVTAESFVIDFVTALKVVYAAASIYSSRITFYRISSNDSKP